MDNPTPRKFRIYCATNKVNNKSYVGFSSKPIEKRWKAHCQSLNDTKRYGMILYHAIKKYGIENFSIQEIEGFDNAIDALEAEEFWIQYLQTRAPNGYNIALGGNAPMLGRNHSEESIEKMRASHTGKVVSTGTKQKMSDALAGHVVLEETRLKISKSLTKRPNKKPKVTIKSKIEQKLFSIFREIKTK